MLNAVFEADFAFFSNFSQIDTVTIFFVALVVIEPFSIECGKTKTKGIPKANHEKPTQHNEPMRTHRKYT